MSLVTPDAKSASSVLQSQGSESMYTLSGNGHDAFASGLPHPPYSAWNPSSGSISTSRVHCTLPLVVTSNVQIVYYVLPLHCQQFEHAPHHHTTSWMGRLRARVSNQSTSASGTRASRKARSCGIVIVIRIIIRIPSRQCRCRLHWARRCHHCCMTGYLGRSLVLFNYC